MRYLKEAVPFIAVPAVALLGIAIGVDPYVMLGWFIGGLYGIAAFDK